MPVVGTAVLGNDGRIVVPVAARRELGLRPGDLLCLECDGESILVRTFDAVAQETQPHLQPCDSPASAD